MSPDPALLVAFLNGTAAVGPHPHTKWWLDAEVQARLDLTADQVQALGPELREVAEQRTKEINAAYALLKRKGPSRS